MKCLRCGWEMGEDSVKCKHCRHYYDNNLRKAKATISYFNSEEEKEKNRKRIVVSLLIIVVLFSIIVFELFYRDITNFFKPPWVVNKCNLVCEGNVNRVIFTKCVCGNGKVINVEK